MVAFVSEIPEPPMNGEYVFRPDVDLQEVRTLLMEVAQANFLSCLQARPAGGALGTVADEMGMVPVDDVPLMVLDDPTALRVAAQVDELSVRPGSHP